MNLYNEKAFIAGVGIGSKAVENHFAAKAEKKRLEAEENRRIKEARQKIEQDVATLNKTNNTAISELNRKRFTAIKEGNLDEANSYASEIESILSGTSEQITMFNRQHGTQLTVGDIPDGTDTTKLSEINMFGEDYIGDTASIDVIRDYDMRMFKNLPDGKLGVKGVDKEGNPTEEIVYTLDKKPAVALDDASTELERAYSKAVKEGRFDGSIEKFRNEEWIPKKDKYQVSYSPSGKEIIKVNTSTGDITRIGGEKFTITSKTPTIATPDGSVVYADENGNALVHEKTGKPIYKTVSKKAQEITEGGASFKSIINTLDKGFDKVMKSPDSIGSIGSSPVDFVVNNVNDFIKLPTKDRLARSQLQQFDGAIAAELRKMVESGVMTEPDFQRYVNMMPSENLSVKEYKQKYNLLKKDLKKKYLNKSRAFQLDKNQLDKNTSGETRMYKGKKYKQQEDGTWKKI